jgi:hypothetical protein
MMASNSLPNDENGQVLRSLAEQGVDLTVERRVDFAHLFPDEPRARAFAQRAGALGFEVNVYEPDAETQEDGITDWDAVCSQAMAPSYENISRTEAQLAAIAREFGGHEDGWGFLDA